MHIASLATSRFSLTYHPKLVERSHQKTRPPFWEMLLEYETKTGVVRILVIFQHRPMLSHINEMLWPRPFE